MDSRTTIPRTGFTITEYAVVAGLKAVMLWTVYRAALTHCYGLQDDYIYLWVAVFGPWQLFDLISAMGRPVYQVLTEWLFARIDGVCQLATVRAFTLASVWLLGMQLYHSARKAGWSPAGASVIAWLVCTSPAIGLFVGWAITFPFVLAMSLGLAAGELALAALARSGGVHALRLGGAVVLLYLALSIYQHSAMAFWLALALATFTPRGIAFWPWRRLFAFALIFGTTLLVYYLIFRWHLARLLDADPVMAIGSIRTGLVGDIVEKLVFLRDSLMLAASPGRFLPAPLLALGVLAVVLAGLLIGLRGCSHRWQAGLLWAGLPLAAYLPSVIIAESVLKVRLLHVLGALLMLYLVWALLRILRPEYAMVLLGALVVYSGWMAHDNTTRHLVGLQAMERELVAAALERHYGPGATHIAIVRPPAANLLGGDWPVIEYAIPTSAPFPDFARVMVQQQYAELFGSDRLPEVVQCPEAAQRDCPELLAHPDLPVIDLNAALTKALTAAGYPGGLTAFPR